MNVIAGVSLIAFYASNRETPFFVQGFLFPTSSLHTSKNTPTIFNRNVPEFLQATTIPTSTQDDTQSSSSNSSFDWKTEWYPLIPVQDLIPDEPNKQTLLGMDLAIWYHEPSQRWRAFADVCPHRLVPLSEGRIEPSLGVLQCAYHGWEFQDDGSCVRIPQLEEPSTAPEVANKRACATSYPVRIEQGLLWVFPTPNEELAASKEPALIPELDDPSFVDTTNFFVRDLPYSWDILVENLADPSHVPFAHHTAMNRASRYDFQKLSLKIQEQSDHGFTATRDPAPVGAGNYDVEFKAPTLLYYTLGGSNANVQLGLGTYCIPIAPGRSRLIARFPFRLPSKFAMAMIRKTPRWITHFSQNIVMDSDVVFLASQDEYIKQKGRAYYMPAKCDTMVSFFRRWLSNVPHNGPEWLGIPAERSDGEPTGWLRPQNVPLRGGRDALLDRYRQHTETCSSCRRAHRNLYILREACILLGITTLAVSAAASWGVGGKKRLLAAIGGALLLTPRLFLRPLIMRFECMPWPRRLWRKPSEMKLLSMRATETSREY